MIPEARLAAIAKFLRDQDRWLCDNCISRLMATSGGRMSDLTRRLAKAKRYFIRMSNVECAECGTFRKPCTRALAETPDV